MKLSVRRILTGCLACLLSLWLVGCQSQDSPERPWDGDLYLRLQVSTLEDRDHKTRGYEDAIGDAEKMQTLRVIIVDNGNVSNGNEDTNAGNSQKGVVLYNRYVDFSSKPVMSYSDDEKLKFKVDFSRNLRIYLIANEAGLPDNIRTVLTAPSLSEGWLYTENLLEDLVISVPTAGDPAIDNSGTDVKPIPMSEFFDVETKEKPENITLESELTETKQFFITRALSKFSFVIKKEIVDEDSETGDKVVEYPLAVKSIKISGLSSESYLLPNNTVYSKEKYDPEGNDDEGRTIESFDVPESATIGEYVFSIPDNLDTNNELNYSYAPKLYFAESKGIVAPESNEDESEGENESSQGIFQCSILLAGENEYLPPVTLPNLPALPRNTHVIVKIKLSLHEIKFKVTVAPWEPGGRAEIDVTEEKNEEISN